MLVQQNKLQRTRRGWLFPYLFVIGSVFVSFVIIQRNRMKFQHQQITSARRLIEMEESEKGRTARELHDITGQLIMGITGAVEKLDLPDDRNKAEIQGKISTPSTSLRAPTGNRACAWTATLHAYGSDSLTAPQRSCRRVAPTWSGRHSRTAAASSSAASTAVVGAVEHHGAAVDAADDEAAAVLDDDRHVGATRRHDLCGAVERVRAGRAASRSTCTHGSPVGARRRRRRSTPCSGAASTRSPSGRTAPRAAARVRADVELRELGLRIADDAAGGGCHDRARDERGGRSDGEQQRAQGASGDVVASGPRIHPGPAAACPPLLEPRPALVARHERTSCRGPAAKPRQPVVQG